MKGRTAGPLFQDFRDEPICSACGMRSGGREKEDRGERRHGGNRGSPVPHLQGKARRT